MNEKLNQLKKIMSGFSDESFIENLKTEYTSGLLQTLTVFNTSINMYLVCRHIFRHEKDLAYKFINEALGGIQERILEEILKSMDTQLGDLANDELFSEDLKQTKETLRAGIDCQYQEILKSVFSIFEELYKEMSKTTVQLS